MLQEFILFTAVLFAFFLYAIYFLKADFINLSQSKIREKLFLKRVSLVKKMCLSCNQIEQLESVDKYFHDYILSQYKNDETKSEIIDQLQLLIMNRLKLINLEYGN